MKKTMVILYILIFATITFSLEDQEVNLIKNAIINEDTSSIDAFINSLESEKDDKIKKEKTSALILLSIMQSKLKMLKYVQQKGIKLTEIEKMNNEKYCFTLLGSAAIYSNREMIEYLLSLGCNVNEKGSNGETPLYLAAVFGKYNGVKELLRNGAINNLKTENYGFTPLMVASQCFNIDNIK